MIKNSLVSFLVLDFFKQEETKKCLTSIREKAKFNHKIIYLDNGSFSETYPNKFYEDGLCDVIIRKKNGFGGGSGQTDLIRFCDTEYFFFVQNDQFLIQEINEDILGYFINLLNDNFHCIDLNGDQSGNGIWTDRAHFMKTAVFNDLGPFPNGGPGDDITPWNEEFLQKEFQKRGYNIAHISPLFFQDNGKNSIREAGDGLYKHNCDNKKLWVLKWPTYITEPYPPLNDEEWKKVLNKEWEQGSIPQKWKPHSFNHWNND